MKSKPYSQRDDLEKILSNWSKTLGLFSRREYSVSIVRAAVTAELALNYVIRQELSHKHGLPTPFVDGLLLWANGIQGKIDKLYLPITKGAVDEEQLKRSCQSIRHLNKQRNDIAHRGEFRKKETAEKFVSLAEREIMFLIRKYNSSFSLKAFDPNARASFQPIIPGVGIVDMPFHPPSDED